MKAFKKKYVVISRTEDGMPSVEFFTKDKHRNNVPAFYDTKADAVLAIAEFMQETAFAVKQKQKKEDAMNECFNRFLAETEMDKDGNLYITTLTNYGDEVIFEGHINELIH